jgi:hypothetical protein
LKKEKNKINRNQKNRDQIGHKKIKGHFCIFSIRRERKEKEKKEVH